VVLCRKAKLFSDAFVAIDRSKFKALNNRDKNFTRAKVKRRLKQIDESIIRALAACRASVGQQLTSATSLCASRKLHVFAARQQN
jgi:hypothetical protein